MKLNDFYQLMEEIETVANAYNMHITHFVAGETIELTIEKEEANETKQDAPS